MKRRLLHLPGILRLIVCLLLHNSLKTPSSHNYLKFLKILSISQTSVDVSLLKTLFSLSFCGIIFSDATMTQIFHSHFLTSAFLWNILSTAAIHPQLCFFSSLQIVYTFTCYLLSRIELSESALLTLSISGHAFSWAPDSCLSLPVTHLSLSMCPKLNLFSPPFLRSLFLNWVGRIEMPFSTPPSLYPLHPIISEFCQFHCLNRSQMYPISLITLLLSQSNISSLLLTHIVIIVSC